jgi:uncharacterized protein (DUF697 family)
MDNKIHMQLGHPILIAIYSFSLLSIGAAIGARWGQSPHMAIWMAVLGSGLMVAHDMLLAAAPQYDAVWNLGDIVGYGASPNKVVDLVRQLGGIVIRGNHDRACSGVMKFSEFRDFNSIASYAAAWTQEALSDENKKWLSSLSRDVGSQQAGPLRQNRSADPRRDARSGSQPSALDKFQANSSANNTRGPAQCSQSHCAVFGVEEPVQRSTAGFHPPRHFRLCKALLRHCESDLAGDHALDGIHTYFFVDALFSEPAIESRAEVLFLHARSHGLNANKARNDLIAIHDAET